MTETSLDPTVLAQFTGTEHWYHHGLFRNFTYTDGVKYVADSCGAYWLIDELVCNQLKRKVRGEDFQVWKLRVSSNKPTAKLSVEDGNGNRVWGKNIEYTDFPHPGVELWLVDTVIMLPSEY